MPVERPRTNETVVRVVDAILSFDGQENCVSWRYIRTEVSMPLMPTELCCIQASWNARQTCYNGVLSDFVSGICYSMPGRSSIPPKLRRPPFKEYTTVSRRRRLNDTAHLTDHQADSVSSQTCLQLSHMICTSSAAFCRFGCYRPSISWAPLVPLRVSTSVTTVSGSSTLEG